ncbi:hypothetical protein [[Clostridium] scindens]|uniref:hypothetical protein n=1 Tax=Clostridium scindens (strain JCM 10418 / VPI 12708) TaxID=29347 RepID=UPI00298D03D9|nr:hypothetical protein [[Clostridium] scindens]
MEHCIIFQPRHLSGIGSRKFNRLEKKKSLPEHGSGSGSSVTGNFYKKIKKGVVSDDYWN